MRGYHRVRAKRKQEVRIIEWRNPMTQRRPGVRGFALSVGVFALLAGILIYPFRCGSTSHADDALREPARAVLPDDGAAWWMLVRAGDMPNSVCNVQTTLCERWKE